MSDDADTRPLRRWLGAADVPTGVMIACREHQHLDRWCHPHPGTPQVIFRLQGCLADLPSAAIIEILAGGALSVACLLDGCAHRRSAREVVAQAALIAAAVADGRPVHSVTEPPEMAVEEPHPIEGHGWTRSRPSRQLLVPVLDARAMPVSRRLLFGAGRPLPPPDPHPGIRLHAAVRELLGDAAIPPELDMIPTGAASLQAPACGAAGVCVRACPTQALTLELDDIATAEPPTGQQFALTVEPGRCIDCGLCVDLCPESAMERIGPLPWAQALEGGQRSLRIGLVRRCSRCGTPYRTAGSLCNVCTFRTSNPFGSQLPPGFSRNPKT